MIPVYEYGKKLNALVTSFEDTWLPVDEEDLELAVATCDALRAAQLVLQCQIEALQARVDWSKAIMRGESSPIDVREG